MTHSTDHGECLSEFSYSSGNQSTYKSWMSFPHPDNGLVEGPD